MNTSTSASSRTHHFGRSIAALCLLLTFTLLSATSVRGDDSSSQNAQADLMIKKASDVDLWYVGDGTHGWQQQVFQSVAAGETASYTVKVVNTVLRPRAYVIKAEVSKKSDWSVSCRAGRDEVSEAILSDSGWRTWVLVSGGSQTFTVDVTPSATAKSALTCCVAIKAFAKGEDKREKPLDAVEAKTTRMDEKGERAINFRPNLLIRKEGEVLYVGEDHYCLDGTKGKLQYVKKGTTAVYHIRVKNKAKSAEEVFVNGPIGLTRGWKYRYYDAETGGRDISAQIRELPGWSTGLLGTGGYRDIRLEVTPNEVVRDDEGVWFLVKARSKGDLSARDTVQIATNVGRYADLMIRKQKEGGGSYVGEHIYNTTGKEQTKSQKVTPAGTAVYIVKVKNIITVPENFVLRGSGGKDGSARQSLGDGAWEVKYYDGPEEGTKDITDEVTGSGGFLLHWLAPGAGREFRMEVTAAGNGQEVATRNSELATATSGLGASNSALLANEASEVLVTGSLAGSSPSESASSTTVQDAVKALTRLNTPVVLSATPAHLPADGESESTLRVSVKTRSGQACPGVSVRLRASAGKLSSWKVNTGPEGTAEVKLTAGRKVEGAIVTAWARVEEVEDPDSLGEEDEESGSCVVEFTDLKITAEPDEILANGTSRSKITVKVTTKDGKPVQGVPVDLETTLGTLSASEVTTDAEGKGEVELTSTTELGGAIVTATRGKQEATTAVGFLRNQAIPELLIESLKVRPRNNKRVAEVGDAMKVTLVVRNVAPTPATIAMKLDFYEHLAERPKERQEGTVRWEVGPLPGKSAITVTGEFVATIAGTYQAWAQMDTENQQPELNEGNNIKGPVQYQVEERSQAAPDNGEEPLLTVRWLISPPARLERGEVCQLKWQVEPGVVLDESYVEFATDFGTEKFIGTEVEDGIYVALLAALPSPCKWLAIAVAKLDEESYFSPEVSGEVVRN